MPKSKILKSRKSDLIKKVSDSLKAKDLKPKQNLKPIREHVADMSMVKKESSKRSISRRASDIEATVDKALKTGDKKLATSSARLAAASGDTGLLRKLIKKERIGSKVKKRYEEAKTPYRRVLASPDIEDKIR